MFDRMMLARVATAARAGRCGSWSLLRYGGFLFRISFVAQTAEVILIDFSIFLVVYIVPLLLPRLVTSANLFFACGGSVDIYIDMRDSHTRMLAVAGVQSSWLT